MKKFVLCAIAAALLVVSTNAQKSFQCPDKDGQYEDPIQCDKYYECKEGVAKERLCPDGLVFDELIRKINKCDQPFNVDCGDRIELQPPKSSKLCPRKNGFFAHPDAQQCSIFYNCIDGDPIENKCANGLHFHEDSGTCEWPDTANRGDDCIKDGKVLSDGFECPKNPPLDPSGQVVSHPKYAHPTDCQKFYVCLNGVEPRDLGCQIGEVYNEETQRCDAPENVPGCEEWYKDSDDKKHNNKDN